jgi:hypothetical protein
VLCPVCRMLGLRFDQGLGRYLRPLLPLTLLAMVLMKTSFVISKASDCRNRVTFWPARACPLPPSDPSDDSKFYL